ncbi:interleukin-17F-like [Hippocampus zosterae]|uniref:interleukin-17F-like n=1 Tax=Hippocampus zosterae TaxID=109293 RepID=UPI00223CB142|nr:interleukin-17F-like [Hippocampus zosterae]
MLSMPNAAVATVAMTTMVALLSGGTAGAGADGRSGRSWMAKTQTVSLELNPDILRPPETLRPLQNRSISPWTYNVSQDAWVLPPVSEARCLLRGCLDSNGAEDLRLRSRPILHQVLLLRRLKSPAGAPRQSRRYRLEPRLVAVGCTCVREREPRRPPPFG